MHFRYRYVFPSNNLPKNCKKPSQNHKKMRNLKKNHEIVPQNMFLKTSKLTEKDDSIDVLSLVSTFKITVWLLIGGISLYFGSDWLVKGAVVIAKEIGVSEAVISVSIIAVGTSIPELAASVMAVVRNEKSISLGNLIGSNIFNIGSVLGLTAMIKPIVVDDPLIVSRDLIWMLIFAAILLPFSLILKRNEIRKTEGFALVFVYGVFIYTVFVS